MESSETNKLPAAYQDQDILQEDSGAEHRRSVCFIKPFSGRCVVEREEFKYTGALILPKTTRQLPTIGHVRAVGDDDHKCLLGKRVLFTRMSGIPVYVQDRPKLDVFSYEELVGEVLTNEEMKFEMEDYSLMNAE
jgi:co-chaperonin GroES (HSP10)